MTDFKTNTLNALVHSLRSAGFQLVPGRGFGTSVSRLGKCEVQLGDQGHGEIGWWVYEHAVPERLKPDELLTGHRGEAATPILTVRITPGLAPIAMVMTRNATGDDVEVATVGPMPAERLAEHLIDVSTREVAKWTS